MDRDANQRRRSGNYEDKKRVKRTETSCRKESTDMKHIHRNDNTAEITHRKGLKTQYDSNKIENRKYHKIDHHPAQSSDDSGGDKQEKRMKKKKHGKHLKNKYSPE
uniref:Uncharacterized protein n=1 Tax=Arion vulgaris TaxID=1028688 RepID=A0A0B6ZML2_9EUPU